MDKKEKDTTVWKPKGDQKITRPSGPAPRRRKVFKSEHRASKASGIRADISSGISAGGSGGLGAGKSGGSTGRSAGYDAPSTGIGKLGLLLGVGAIIAALARGVKNSDYYNDQDTDQNKDQD